jgi:hypothetical protein
VRVCMCLCAYSVIRIQLQVCVLRVSCLGEST